ncbi:MAG: hypothetical protein LIP23_01350, partial [Planctomycetes bacterium]|nr:hypothetical protein [Planctomycetota bacterium]
RFPCFVPASAPVGQSHENARASAGKEVQFQTPGLNKPEFELLKPSGYLEHFLSLERSGGEVREKVAAEARTLLRDLLSDDPQRAMEGMRQLPGKDKEVLRETARQLTRMEQEILRSDNNLRSLAEAATSIRDLGRQALAVKAENLAARDREPGVMLAEVPFKLADDTGSGRMQMFYRQSRGKKEGWTSRVILDLNTTSMGPVLGDMRFFGSDMVLNMFVEKQDIADFLATSAADLVDALRDKGFRMRPRFMVLPPPPPPPEIRAERPDMADAPADSDTPISPSGKKGLLDTKA